MLAGVIAAVALILVGIAAVIKGYRLARKAVDNVAGNLFGSVADSMSEPQNRDGGLAGLLGGLASGGDNAFKKQSDSTNAANFWFLGGIVAIVIGIVLICVNVVF